MTIKHMRIFLTVCECGNNLSEAARRLYMTQPSVTVAVREIEKHYGLPLFDRLSKRLYLTEAGKEFRDYAMRIIGLYEDMEAGMRNWDSCGTIRVGASLTIGSQFMPSYVKAFRERRPGVSVRGLVGPSRMLERKILENELDLALVETPIHEASLVAEAYMEDSLEVIAPAVPPWYEGQVLSAEDFKGQDILLREPGSGTRETFDRVLAAAGLSVTPVWEATSTTALINAAICGIGITVLPGRRVRDAIDARKVYRLEVEGLDFRRKFYIVRHQDKCIIGLIRDFIEVCKEEGE